MRPGPSLAIVTTIALLLSVAAAAYLVYAMLRPEQF